MYNYLLSTLYTGQLAAILQVYYGTKHRRFAGWLDVWLKCRKQLGLLAFAFSLLHGVISILLMTPNYYGSWYHKAKVTLPGDDIDDIIRLANQTISGNNVSVHADDVDLQVSQTIGLDWQQMGQIWEFLTPVFSA